MCRFLLHFTDRQSNNNKSTTIIENLDFRSAHRKSTFSSCFDDFSNEKKIENVHLYRITMKYQDSDQSRIKQ